MISHGQRQLLEGNGQASGSNGHSRVVEHFGNVKEGAVSIGAHRVSWVSQQLHAGHLCWHLQHHQCHKGSKSKSTTAGQHVCVCLKGGQSG